MGEGENVKFYEFIFGTGDPAGNFVRDEKKCLDLDGKTVQLGLHVDGNEDTNTEEGLKKAVEEGKISFKFDNSDYENAIFNNNVNTQDENASQNLGKLRNAMKEVDDHIKEVFKSEVESMGLAPIHKTDFAEKLKSILNGDGTYDKIFDIRCMIEAGNNDIYCNGSINKATSLDDFAKKIESIFG